MCVAPESSRCWRINWPSRYCSRLKITALMPWFLARWTAKAFGLLVISNTTWMSGCLSKYLKISSALEPLPEANTAILNFFDDMLLIRGCKKRKRTIRSNKCHAENAQQKYDFAKSAKPCKVSFRICRDQFYQKPHHGHKQEQEKILNGQVVVVVIKEQDG